MQLVQVLDGHHLDGATLVAESSEFAVFDLGYDTFALVHRHAAVDWQAITISGDGVFRVLEILGHAARRLYRDVAADASRRPLPPAPGLGGAAPYERQARRITSATSRGRETSDA